MRIWKISHGDDAFRKKKDDPKEKIREVLEEEQFVAIGIKDTRKPINFRDDIKKGDLFYLCYSDRVQLIGVFTSDNTYPCVEMGDNWIKRPYEKIYSAIRNDKFKEVYEGINGTLDGYQRKWTPSGFSTCFEIPQEEIEGDFEKTILKPYFNITAKDLPGGNTPSIAKNAPSKKTKLDISLNTILYGPPGTGKTYHTAIYAVAICDPDDATLDELKGKAKKKEEYDKIYNRYQELITEGRVKFTTFHQSYGYEDFIEGIKPDIDDKGNIVYKVKPGVFKQFCCDDSQNKVFIIDEINRGNISKIFGELITLIEDDKRGTTYVTLPLSPDEKFTVPKNVYILGTMNTADRSIALMDTALRRRFTFVEMMPEPKVFVKNGVDVVIDDVNIRLLLEAMNERIEYLYDREHTIGHAYFKEFIDGKGSISDLRETFKNKIIPLLQEYFYDDYEKIALVLNDDNASDKFIKTKNVPAEWLGKQYDEGDKYDINPEIWNEDLDFSARLRAIYEKKQKNQTEETGE